MNNISCMDSRQFLVRLGGEIRAARREKHLPAIKVAELAASRGLPIHRVTLARIEQGEQCPSLIHLLGLAKVLGADWRQWVERAESGENSTPPPVSIERFLAAASEVAKDAQLYRDTSAHV